MVDWVYKSALTAAVSATSYLLGGFDKAIQILLTLIIVDYITGIIRAAINGKLDSRVGLKGICRKVFIFAVITVAVMIERFIGQPESIHNMVAYFYIVNEAISILENVDDFIPIPEQLRQLLNRLKNKGRKKK
jgi:toxin secretion/phage lysis holin